MNPEEVPKIQDIQKNITRVTKEAMVARGEVDKLSMEALNSVETRFMQAKDSVVTTVTQAFEKAKDAIDGKITNGLGALESMKNETVRAVNQAKVNNMTVMTNLKR